MKILEVSLSEQTVTKLEAVSRRLGPQPEDLVRVSVEDKLSQLDEDFQSAADYARTPNCTAVWPDALPDARTGVGSGRAGDFPIGWRSRCADYGALESAVAQPAMTFDQADLYPTLSQKAVALTYSLIENTLHRLS